MILAMSTMEVIHTIMINYIRCKLPSFYPVIFPSWIHIFLELSKVQFHEWFVRLFPTKRVRQTLPDTRTAKSSEWFNLPCEGDNKWRIWCRWRPICLLVSFDTLVSFSYWVSGFLFRSQAISGFFSNTRLRETWWMFPLWCRGYSILSHHIY